MVSGGQLQHLPSWAQDLASWRPSVGPPVPILVCLARPEAYPVPQALSLFPVLSHQCHILFIFMAVSRIGLGPCLLSADQRLSCLGASPGSNWVRAVT